jgi:hypothetical protein
MSSPPPTRRDFLRTSLSVAALAAIPEQLVRDPYAPLSPAPSRLRAGAVRVRGRVVAAGRGVRGARVSDGLHVVATDADGRFTLVTTAEQRYVTLCPPPGYALPTHQAGTARCYVALAPDGGAEQEVRFELQPLGEDDDRHGFVVLADPQTQNAFDMGRFHAETVPDVIATRAALGGVPLFGVGCGDLMYDDLSLYPEYERAVTRMGLPFVQVVGNHDLDFSARVTEGATATFERHFGPSHYSFDRGRVHYMVLNDVFWHGAGYIGYLTQEQLSWVEHDLAHVATGTPVVVFLHIPLTSSEYARRGNATPGVSTSVNNREQLDRLLEPYHAHVIAGHTHESEHRVTGRRHEHVAGAACGGWWTGDICYDGTPNGYAVYEVAGERVTWRYKATGRPADHQLRLYRPGSEPTAPGDLVANVWDWDPSWTVVWYEDGERRGLMSRRTGLDPLSVELHRGPDLPKYRPWVDPIPTSHLFYAAVSPAAREWAVEATDGTGRRYREVLGRG